MAIGALERAVLERDSSLAASVLDPDFSALQVEPEPSVVDRGDWLQALREDRVNNYEVLERFIHEDGDAAAVLQQVRLAASAGAQDRPGLEVVTDVWRLRADGWRLWRRHRTPSVEDLSAMADERRAARAAEASRDNADPGSRATVTEVAAVIAAIANAGHDPAELTPQDMEQYVEAFRALKHQGEPA
jgi:hypothetical protein